MAPFRLPVSPWDRTELYSAPPPRLEGKANTERSSPCASSTGIRRHPGRRSMAADPWRWWSTGAPITFLDEAARSALPDECRCRQVGRFDKSRGNRGSQLASEHRAARLGVGPLAA